MQGGRKMKSSKMFKSVASFTLVAAMVAPTLVTAPVSVDAAKAMSLSAKSALLPVGSTKSVSVKNAPKKSKFTWKSSNKKVAKVSGKTKKATVKAVGAGTAKISCIVKKGKSKKTVSGLTVKVRQKITSFAMQDKSSKAISSAEINVGDKLQLKGAINNNAAGSTINQTVKWTSSDTKVAKVAKKGYNKATVTGLSAGSATITAVVAPNAAAEKKTAQCVVKVKGSQSSNDKKNEATPAPTPKYGKDILYKQTYDVTRWYNPDTTGAINGHKHDGYKNNNFAIWMVGFYDNKYSTNESDLMAYGPNIMDCEVQGQSKKDFRDTPLTLTGEFSYEGTKQKTVLLQVNYTSPSDYPILWKWEKGASKSANEYAKELKISGVNGSENLDPGQTGKVNVTFTVPKNALNGDKDPETGKNYGLYLYFPNKPGGALAYVKDNTFHFKNFLLKVK